MQSASGQRWRQWLSAAAVAVGCGAAIAGLQLPQLQQLQQGNQTAPLEAIHQEIAAEQTRLSLLQKMPSLGFDNLISDWTFLNFLQYFGDQAARQKTGYRLSPEFFKVILRRNPYFIQAYTFLSTSSAIYAGMADQSTAIMKQGLSSMKPNVPPNSFFAWRQLGIDQLLFLGDAQAARQSFETAAHWAETSSLPGSQQVAIVSQKTAEFLARNPSSKTAQVAAWTMVLGNAPDDRTRQIAIQRIQQLGSRVIENPDGSFSIQAPDKD